MKAVYCNLAFLKIAISQLRPLERPFRILGQMGCTTPSSAKGPDGSRGRRGRPQRAAQPA